MAFEYEVIGGCKHLCGATVFSKTEIDTLDSTTKAWGLPLIYSVTISTIYLEGD